MSWLQTMKLWSLSVGWSHQNKQWPLNLTLKKLLVNCQLSIANPKFRSSDDEHHVPWSVVALGVPTIVRLEDLGMDRVNQNKANWHNEIERKKPATAKWKHWRQHSTTNTLPTTLFKCRSTSDKQSSQAHSSPFSSNCQLSIEIVTWPCHCLCYRCYPPSRKLPAPWPSRCLSEPRNWKLESKTSHVIHVHSTIWQTVGNQKWTDHGTSTCNMHRKLLKPMFAAKLLRELMNQLRDSVIFPHLNARFSLGHVCHLLVDMFKLLSHLCRCVWKKFVHINVKHFDSTTKRALKLQNAEQ